MQTGVKGDGELFDDWPEQYDTWFSTPIGALVQEYETALLLDMLKPRPEELLLDVGCGTGVFTGKTPFDQGPNYRPGYIDTDAAHGDFKV